jgi:DNA-binding protein HU-beta
VNKLELIAKIVKDTGLTKVSAAGAVESLLDGIKKSLKKGNAVTFVGFGTFQTSIRKARTARNPQTGAAVKVPKRRVVRFKAGKALKDSVN